MLKFGSRGENSVVYKCTVRLLEDTEILECEYKAHHKGKYLLEIVCKQLNLIEQDYLGLRYVDSMDQRHWLDMAKSIVKQIKDIDPVLFSFRVKFYPPDPFRLKEEITRYQIFLQLKRDLLHGRLYCTANESAQLGALIVQGELGDYDPEIHVGNYASDYKLLLKQTETIEEKIMEIHQKQLKGQSPSQAENVFLRVACQLDTYGIDPHPVKDHRGNQLYLGINYSGILTFQGSRKTHHFRWPDIQKINYEGKMFIIHLNYNDKHTVGFKCATGAACRHVWRCAIEQMLFFTLPTSSDAPSVVTGGGFFSWGTKFKYTGRTEREILEDMGAPTREEPAIQRTSSLRRKASSVPATPSTPLQPHLGYSSLPRSSHSDAGGSRMETSNSAGVLSNIDGVNFTDNIALLETVSEDQEAASGKSRMTGMKDDLVDHFNEYYFRDSFEHSSSESQLVDSSYKGYEAQSHRSSRSQTPLQGTADGRLCVPVHHGPYYSPGNKQQLQSRKFSIVKVFVPSLVFVLLLIAFLTVVMLETDCELFGSLRSIPEMISLRYQYYEPWKQYFRKKIPSIF